MYPKKAEMDQADCRANNITRHTGWIHIERRISEQGGHTIMFLHLRTVLQNARSKNQGTCREIESYDSSQRLRHQDLGNAGGPCGPSEPQLRDQGSEMAGAGGEHRLENPAPRERT